MKCAWYGRRRESSRSFASHRTKASSRSACSRPESVAAIGKLAEGVEHEINTPMSHGGQLAFRQRSVTDC